MFAPHILAVAVTTEIIMVEESVINSREIFLVMIPVSVIILADL